MAASRQVGRTALRLSSVVGSNSQLCNIYRPSYKVWKGEGAGAPTSLLHHMRPPQFTFQACGYCSQQVVHASSSSPHTCSPALTPSHAPTPPHTPLHVHAAARRINRRTELDFDELRALQVAGDIALIDVRDTQELSNYGEIPGSLNIPLCKIKGALQLSEDEWEQEFNIEKPDKDDRNLVFYARGPNASSTAVEIAHRLGFTRSRHYIGGWEDYCQQTGVPLKKTQDDGFSASGNYYMNRFDQYFL